MFKGFIRDDTAETVYTSHAPISPWWNPLTYLGLFSRPIATVAIQVTQPEDHDTRINFRYGFSQNQSRLTESNLAFSKTEVQRAIKNGTPLADGRLGVELSRSKWFFIPSNAANVVNQVLHIFLLQGLRAGRETLRLVLKADGQLEKMQVLETYDQTAHVRFQTNHLTREPSPREHAAQVQARRFQFG